METGPLALGLRSHLLPQVQAKKHDRRYLLSRDPRPQTAPRRRPDVQELTMPFRQRRASAVSKPVAQGRGINSQGACQAGGTAALIPYIWSMTNNELIESIRNSDNLDDQRLVARFDRLQALESREDLTQEEQHLGDELRNVIEREVAWLAGRKWKRPKTPKNAYKCKAKSRTLTFEIQIAGTYYQLWVSYFPGDRQEVTIIRVGRESTRKAFAFKS
jgi:hypothetical protein